jgi:hypothetical protein
MIGNGNEKWPQQGMVVVFTQSSPKTRPWFFLIVHSNDVVCLPRWLTARMTDRLPPHLRRLFEPRPPIKYLKPLDRHPSQRRGPTVSGIGDLVHLLKDYDPDYVPRETLEERRKRMKEEKQALHEARLKEALEKCKQHIFIYDSDYSGNACLPLISIRGSA